MNTIYVVTRTEWIQAKESWETEVVYCFELRSKAEEYVNNRQQTASVYDAEYNIEIIEVVE